MNEIWSSFSKWFNENTSSPLYFTYIAFFIAWNWKLFQIIFLENASLFSQPRIEYITEELNFHIGWAGAFSPVINWIFDIGWHLLPPVGLTYAAIVWLPYIQKWALEKYLEGSFERKRIFEIKKMSMMNGVLV